MSCSDEQVSFGDLLELSNETPLECESELEHLLLLAGFYDLKSANLYNEMICTNHRSALLAVRQRKNNCQLYVDVFNKKKRATSSLQRVTKPLALRVWFEHHVNVLVSVWFSHLNKKIISDIDTIVGLVHNVEKHALSNSTI